MKLTSLGPEAPFFRFLTPRWAHLPLSGAGAARAGGRLNRPDVHALYLSVDIETAAAEYQQIDSLLAPATVATYLVSLGSVVDFSGGYAPDAWDPAWQDLWCDWRQIAFVDNVEPPSWLLGDLALQAGASGILFPSRVRAGGINLVVYLDSVAVPDRLRVHDPDKRLPKDPSSWA
jgi:RES domain-containing protein